MTIARRSFLLRAGGAGLGLAFSGSLAQVLGSSGAGAGAGAGAGGAGAGGRVGYGALVPDPAGIVDLPRGFHYRVLSREAVDVLDEGQPVPAAHDGMAAFATGRGSGRGSGRGRGRITLVRNHEIDPEAVAEDGVAPVPHVPGRTYDPNGTGGTTTLVVDGDRRLVSHEVSLAGTSNNCAGGPTPWGTWLTCEETDEVIDGVKHGYVFEVDPAQGGDPRPIRAMGRFDHEAVSFDGDGTAYLTEDADGPHGYLYRFRPERRRGGRGSLHAGGQLSALLVPELDGADLSAVTEPGTVLRRLRWVPITVPDPGEGDTVRTLHDATHIPKCEGTWSGDGCIWFVSSRGDGPDAEDDGERSDGLHGGQIWCYDPGRGTLRLVVRFEPDDRFEGPDNITVSAHGFAVMCTDGEDDDQFLAGTTPRGRTFPLAYNRLSDDEFAGACFSPDGRTLFANIQQPGHTLAIWGPWRH
jgi:secreted PhoX family phosphatase